MSTAASRRGYQLGLSARLTAALVAVLLMLLTGCASDGDGGGSPGAAGDGTIIGDLKPGSVDKRFVKSVNQAGNLCADISAPLVAAQIDTESSWNPNANSRYAEGIAQFTPSTWKTWGKDYNKDGKANVWDPADAIPSQGAYMCSLAKKARNGQGLSGSLIELALAGYNAGWGAVQKAGGVPKIAETQQYVQKIPQLAISKYGGRWSQQMGQGPADADPGARKVLAAMQSQLNVPYVWGGGTLSGPGPGLCSAVQPNACHMSGFDCSGLSRYGVWVGAHWQMPRTASQQQSFVRKYDVKYSGNDSLKPGDLLFEGNPATHVATYWGGGKVIEEPHPGLGARITTLWFKPSSVARPPYSKLAKSK